MAITGRINLGFGAHALTVSHDPVTVATDAPIGSMLIRESDGVWFRKLDNGSTTNVAVASLSSFASRNIAVVGDSGGPSAITVINVPAFELSDGSTKGVIGHIEMPEDMSLAVNPEVHVPLMVSSAGGGNGNIRIQTRTKYLAVGELVNAAVSETILQTEAIINTLYRIHHFDVVLNRTLMAAGDHIEVRVERIGADGADTFTGAVGVFKELVFVYTRQ
jgi:hypothetical protein